MSKIQVVQLFLLVTMLAACSAPAVTPAVTQPFSSDVSLPSGQATPPTIDPNWVGPFMKVTGTPGVLKDPVAIPAPWASSVANSVITLPMPEGLTQGLREKYNQIGEGIFKDPLVIGWIFSNFLNSLTPSECRYFSQDLASHMADESFSRMRRIGGAEALFKLADDLAAKKVVIKSFVMSKTFDRIGVWFHWTDKGEDIFMIFAEGESRTTAIPLAFYGDPIRVGAERINNFLRITEEGELTSGQYWVAAAEMRTISSAVHLGALMLDATMSAEIVASLANFGYCLKMRLSNDQGFIRKLEKEQRLKAKSDQSEFIAEIATQMAYSSQEELLSDIQFLESLGLASTLSSSSQGREVIVYTTILAGGTLMVIWLAPVTISVYVDGVAAMEVTKYIIVAQGAGQLMAPGAP